MIKKKGIEYKMNKEKLIVIEGACDGIGKTTQFNLLKEHLKKDKEKVITHHFPSYGSDEALLIEKYLNGELGSLNEVSPYLINSLYAIDRAITWNKSLKEEYKKGKIILLDRYTTSSLIYQSALIEDINKKKDFIKYVCDYEYNKLNIKIPDNVIFLEAPFDLVTKMRKERTTNIGVKNDIHETNLEFMKKVYDNAIFLADYLNWNKIKCNNAKTMKSKEEIHNNIYKLIKKK